MTTDFFEQSKTLFERWAQSDFKCDIRLENLRRYLITCKVLGIKPKSQTDRISDKEMSDVNSIVEEDMKTLFEAYKTHFPERDESNMKLSFERDFTQYVIDDRYCTQEMLDYCKERGLKDFFDPMFDPVYKKGKLKK